MKAPAKFAGRQLLAVERWRKQQLECARVAHAELVNQLAQQQGVVAQLQRLVHETQQSIRDAFAEPGALSATVLLRLTHFADRQVVELRLGESALDAVKVQVTAAHDLLETRFRELSVIERVCERRAAERLQVEHRRQQGWLDEQAASRKFGCAT